MAEATGDVEHWLPLARGGSTEALGEALEACRAYLLMIADRELNTELRAKGGASDLVQQTFLEAQQDFTRFHGKSEEALLAWLRQMLLNNLANFHRHYHGTAKRQTNREVVIDPGNSSLQPGLQIAADNLTPSREMMSAEDDAALLSALERLPDDYRKVIHLRYQEERPFAEIAELMQRTENAVQKLWLRAVERLQKEMQTLP